MEALLEQLPESSFSAISSISAALHQPYYSRMSAEHGWGLGGVYDNPWIQVDLLAVKTLVKIATRGRSTRVQWVKTYKLAYSTLDEVFEYIQLSNGRDKVSKASFDSNTVIEHCLNHVLAVKVRMYPQTWQSEYCIVFWELFAVV